MMMLTLNTIRYINSLIISKEQYFTILYHTAYEYMNVGYPRQTVEIYNR